MSVRDEQLLATLDVAVTELASIVDHSRQTVTRAIKSNNDYLNAGKLKKLYDAKCSDQSADCEIVKNAILNFFPEQGKLVFGVSTGGVSGNFHLPSSGTFWFFCPDFATFKINYQECLEQVKVIAVSQSCSLTVFVEAADHLRALRFVKPLNKALREAAQHIPVVLCNPHLGVTPPLMAHSSIEHGDSLYFPSSTGFVPAAQHDANRIKCMFLELIEIDGEKKDNKGGSERLKTKSSEPETFLAPG